jgi:hypothetical protein
MAGGPGQQLLDLLWQRYAAQVPYAGTFVRLASRRFVNDHVAFRTLRRPGSGVELVAPVFERLGWRRAGSYDFPDAHLDAIHLSHPDGLPRVFVSQLRVEALSPRAQAILDTLPPDVPAPPGPLEAVADWFQGPGAPPDEAALLALEQESQYGAWLLLFGREVNHFTAAVDDVERWGAALAAAGVPMKGAIEGEPGAPLRQTATRAAPRRVRTSLGEREWPYAYLELAERQPGFDGFVAAQARALFEMTRR